MAYRLVIWVGGVASILIALGVFYMATVDTAYVFQSLVSYGEAGLDPAVRSEARAMFAPALEQAFVPVIALASGWASASQILTVQQLMASDSRMTHP